MLNRSKSYPAKPARRVRRPARGGGVSIAFAGLLAVGLLAADSARAELAERIVFRRESGGLNQIYVMRASDGFIQRKLSTSETDEYNPAWSPDATQIAFDSDYPWEVFGPGTGFFLYIPQIYVTNYEAFEKNDPFIIEEQTFPEEDKSDIKWWRLDVYSPAWSFDGNQIAFVARNSATQPFAQIFKMSGIDGTDPERCTKRLEVSEDYGPTWSPNNVPMPDGNPEEGGELIAFTSEREPESPQIYVMRSDCQPFDDGDPETQEDLHDGPNDIQLTTDTGTAAAPEGEVLSAVNYNPAWSPDGTQIAFTSTRDSIYDINYEIYVMNAADGSNQRRLTDNLAVDYAPTWSSDGTQIAFSSNRDGNFQIYVMNADGSNPRNLSNSNTNDYEPSWSLVPVPEPGASAALATALAALLGLRAGRRQAD